MYTKSFKTEQSTLVLLGLKTFENFKNRCTLVISAEGGHIENAL